MVLVGAEDTEVFRAHRPQRACRRTDCLVFDTWGCMQTVQGFVKVVLTGGGV